MDGAGGERGGPSAVFCIVLAKRLLLAGGTDASNCSGIGRAYRERKREKKRKRKKERKRKRERKKKEKEKEREKEKEKEKKRKRERNGDGQRSRLETQGKVIFCRYC